MFTQEIMSGSERTEGMDSSFQEEKVTSRKSKVVVARLDQAAEILPGAKNLMVCEVKRDLRITSKPTQVPLSLSLNNSTSGRAAETVTSVPRKLDCQRRESRIFTEMFKENGVTHRPVSVINTECHLEILN